MANTTWKSGENSHIYRVWGHLWKISTLTLKVLNIVNRGDWLGNPANIKGTNKDAKIYVGRSTTLHNLLFCAHTLWMNYVTNTFLLVCSSVRSKQLLCLVQGQGQKTEHKYIRENDLYKLSNTAIKRRHVGSHFNLLFNSMLRWLGKAKDALFCVPFTQISCEKDIDCLKSLTSPCYDWYIFQVSTLTLS